MHHNSRATTATTASMTSSFDGGESPDLLDSLMDHLAHAAHETDEGVAHENVDQHWHDAVHHVAAQQQQQQQASLKEAPPEADLAASHDSTLINVPSKASYNLRNQHKVNTRARLNMYSRHRFETDDRKQPPNVTNNMQATHALYFGNDGDDDNNTQATSDGDAEWHDTNIRTSARLRNSAKQTKAVAEKANKGNQKKHAAPRRRKRVRKTYEPEVREYHEVTQDDVLCHRGGFANKHPGNLRYHQVKVTLQPLYEATVKAKKREVTQQLVDAVHAWGGRFLEQEEDTERWFEIHEKKALTKASQALRENYTPDQRAAKRARYRFKKEQEKEQSQQDQEEEEDTEEEQIDEAAAVHEIWYSGIRYNPRKIHKGQETQIQM